MTDTEHTLDHSAEFEDLVARCLEGFDQGGTAAVEGILTTYPEDSEKVREALNRLHGSGLLKGVGDEEVPEQMGEFRLLRRIGGGGMGVVFLAHQASLDREVALGLVRPDYLYFENAKKRFRREVHAVSRLTHPGIVPVWHVGEESSIPYFAMEYVPGCSLGELLDAMRVRRKATGKHQDRRGSVMRHTIARLSPDSASSETKTSGAQLFAGSWEQTCLRITLRVAEAMCHAHERDIIHRDLKPSNVMITADGQVRLVDFGLASLESQKDAEKITKSNSLLGSLNYMSPEQLCLDEIDGRTDVYSLGTTMYELLCLQTPFGTVEPASLREKILQGSSTPLRRVNQGVCRDTETICEKAMAPHREQRYESMQAFADDLRNLLELRPISARPPNLARRATRWIQRHSILSMALLMLVGAVVFLAILWRQEIGISERLALAKARSDQNLLDAEQAKRELQEANSKLADANEELDAERVVAMANVDRAKRAIDNMLANVADRQLRHVPYMGAIRKKLLEEALSLSRDLANQDYKQAAMRLDLAMLELRIGRMQMDFGEHDDAAKNALSSIRGLRSLEAVASRPEQRLQLGNAMLFLGMVRTRQSREGEAQKLLQDAVAIIEPLYESGEKSPLFVHHLANAFRTLQNFYIRRPVRRPEDASWRRDFGQLSMRLREDLVERKPDHMASREFLAREYRRLGAKLSRASRYEEALVQLQRSLELYRGLGVKRLLTSNAINSLAICHGEMAKARMHRGQVEKALAARLAQVELRRQLVQRFPSHVEYHGSLSSALNNLSIVHIKMADGPAAEVAIAEGVGSLRRLLDVHPTHSFFLDNYRNLTVNLCIALKIQKKHVALAKLALLLPQRDRRKGRGNKDAAEFLGIAIYLGGRSAEPDEHWVAARIEEGVAHLKSAADLKAIDVRFLERRSIRPFTAHPDFAALRARLSRTGR